MQRILIGGLSQGIGDRGVSSVVLEVVTVVRMVDLYWFE